MLKKAIAASAIGNATEWFDYGIYAYGVTYISAAIFPGDTEQRDPARADDVRRVVPGPAARRAGLGPLGDRLGRKHVLAITILMMAGATLCVGLVPSYAAIGFWAPMLLVLLRMIQGFSTGGEYGGAATFMAEYAPCRRRGFLGSFLEFGTLAGFSLGALLMLGFSLVLGDDADARLGLAAAVPGRRPARPGRHLPALPAGGHPDIPRAGGEGREGGGDHDRSSRTCSPATGSRSCSSVASSSR